MSIRLLCLIILSTSSGSTLMFAQLGIDYPAPFAPNGHVGELFACQLRLLGGMQVPFVLELEVRNDSGAVISKLRSQALSPEQLPLGLNRANYGQLQWTTVRGRKPEPMTGELMLRPGSYVCVVRALDQATEGVLAEVTQFYTERRHRVGPESKGDTERLMDRKLSSSGQASAEFVHNTWEYEGNALPRTYAQFQMQPTLRVMGLPLFADIRVNTFQGAAFQPMNQFTVGFSGDHLKGLFLEALLEKKRRKAEHLKRLAAGDQAKLYEQQLYDSLLKTPEAKEGLAFLAKKDSLEALKDGYVDSLHSLRGFGDLPMDSLSELQKSRLDSLKQNDPNYRRFQQWVESYEAIEAQAKAYEGYRDMAERKVQLDRYLDHQSLVDTLVPPVSSSDYERLKDLEQGLDAEGLGSPWLRWLMRVNRLSFGANYARFSELTLDRTRTDGVHFAWASDYVFLEVVHGQLLQPVISLEASQASYGRKLTGVRAGVGHKDRHFLAINWQQNADDISSIEPRDSVFQYQVTPQQNIAVSVEGQVSLIDKALRFTSEWAMSATEMDASIAYDTLLGLEKPDLYGTMLRGHSNYVGQQAGYAWQQALKLDLSSLGLKAEAKYKRVDGGYRSNGVAFLQRNIELTELRASKSLWKGRLRLEAMAQYMVHGLDSISPQSNRWGWGTTLDLRIPRWPSLRLSYQPVLMQWEETQYYLHAWTGQAQYSRKIRKTPTQWLLSYNRQQADAGLSTNSYTFNQVLLNATQQLVGLKAQLMEGIGYLHQSSGALPEIETLQLSGGVGFPIGKKLQFDGSVQLNYSFSREHSLGGSTGLNWQLHKSLSWMNRIEMNQYMPMLLDPLLPQTGFVDVLFRSTLRYHW